MIYIKCKKNILFDRLDKRVDEMMNRGLLQEIIDFNDKIRPEDPLEKKDFTKGILQAIGFKEFEPYLEFLSRGGQRDSQESKNILERCVSDVKRNTRNYAKKQRRWLKNNLFPLASTFPSVRIYRLDASDLSLWDSKIFPQALEISKSLGYPQNVSEKTESECRFLLPDSGKKDEIEWKKYRCEFCDRVLNGLVEWNAHLKSKAHKKTKSRKTSKKYKEQQEQAQKYKQQKEKEK